MKKRFSLDLILLLVLLSIIYSSCQQRYWFRGKVNSEKDTGTVEKSYQIAW
jgi:hypothetical protein